MEGTCPFGSVCCRLTSPASHFKDDPQQLGPEAKGLPKSSGLLTTSSGHPSGSVPPSQSGGSTQGRAGGPISSSALGTGHEVGALTQAHPVTQQAPSRHPKSLGLSDLAGANGLRAWSQAGPAL